MGGAYGGLGGLDVPATQRERYDLVAANNRQVRDFAGISAEQAARRLELEDRVRTDMSITLYGWSLRLPDRYDLVFNTSRLDLDRVVRAILAAVRDGTVHDERE